VTGPYVIGCDVGSQGTNAALYAADGELVASAYEAYDLSFPHPGWAEQDPDLWTAAMEAVCGRLVAECPDGPSAIRGLSFGSQLDGMVVCDADGHRLRPALIWMDRRAEAQAAALAERISPQEFYRAVGANLDSSHAVFKALWVRDEEPDVWEEASLLMSPGSYVLHHATGVVAVDHSNASSLALLDPRTKTWSPEALEATAIDPSMLPELGDATQAVGTVTADFAEASGLSPGTVVAIGCGDEMAATLGAGLVEPGAVCDVLGTAEPVCAVSDRPLRDATRIAECHPHAAPARWLLENPGWASGASYRWFRDQLGGGLDYEGLNALAAEAPAGSDGLVFLPWMGGAMAPRWEAEARGSWYGLTPAHGRGHMARALLEGSAYAFRDVVAAIDAAGLGCERVVCVAGGARSTLVRQMRADVTGLPVYHSEDVETTSRGAAMLAAAGLGLHPSVGEAAAAMSRVAADPRLPDAAAAEAYDAGYRRYRRLFDALAPHFAELA
jgi:xylulokinase